MALVVVLSLSNPALAQVAFASEADDGTYAKLFDHLPELGARPLAGKVIVVDPGHGGKESGAVGPGGLLEKDVNLGVGKALAELLKQAGASVTLTRTGDNQVATGSLASDLLARIDVANAARADLFLSIHHNATLDPKNERNMTETYYRMVEPGPSLDAAEAIHRHLLANLLLPQDKLLPGNYAVLRNAQVPAILGEASYLSNAFTEQKLKSPEKQTLEAQAYFAGILDYFSRGTPKVRSLGPLDHDMTRPTMSAQLDGGGSPVDPDSVVFMLDGEPCQAYYDSQRQSASYRAQEPLSNGLHVLSAQFRNLQGNACERVEATMSINRPAQRLELELPLKAVPNSGPIPIRAQVRDALGQPVADGTTVEWSADSGQFVSSVTLTRKGMAIAYLEPPLRGKPRRVRAQCGPIASRLALPKTQRPILFGILGKDKKAISGALVMAIGRRQQVLTQSNEDGLWWIELPPVGFTALRIVKPGYLPLTLPQRERCFVSLQLRSSANPSWSGPIVLNPEGSPDDRDPARRRASRANWQIANFLKGYLEAAGSTVILTRAVDEGPSDVERVRMANARKAGLFLTLSHASESLQTSHYPSSLRGQQIATSIRESLLGEGERKHDGGTVPGSSYPLIQTTCPSVGVRLPYADETNSALARRHAYLVFLGLSVAQPHAATVSIQLVGHGGKPLADSLVSLDGVWHGQTDREGRWAFGNLDPGEHQLVVSDGTHQRTYWIAGLMAAERRSILLDVARPQVSADLALR